MKRRVISLLAILAMSCSMVVFEMPAIAEEASSEETALSSILDDIASGKDALSALSADADEDAIIEAAKSDKNNIEWIDFDWKENPYPRYAYHKVYEAAGYAENDAVKNWSISDPADWAAMRDVADVATEDYFADVTFHLTKDIDFTIDERIKPMGINSNGAGFAGILDGHGYGFNTFYVYVNSSDIYDKAKSSGKDVVHAGLFLRLANCTIRDFGLNSGIIHQASSNTHGITSSFGTVVEGRIPTFERVWSSAIVYARSNARASALVGAFDDYWVKINLNGFVFDGAIVKDASASYSGQIFFGIYGRNDGMFTADGNDFYNIITDFRACNGTVSLNSNGYTIRPDTNAEYSRGGKAALLPFGSADAFDEAKIKNVYGVKRASEGVKEGYILGGGGWGGYDSDSLLTDMSAIEAANAINNNPTSLAEDGAEPVYFKLNNEGKIRPFAKEDFGNSKNVVRLKLTGTRNEEIYVDRNAVYNFTLINKTTGQIFAEVDGFKQTEKQFKLSKSVTVEVTENCTHSYEYEAEEAGKNEHTATCACGYQFAEACTPNEDGYASNDITADAATHSGKCKDCDAAITQNCDFEYDEANNKYVCADCERTVDALAPMVPGNVDGKSGVTLFDAIQLLKKTVDPSVDANVHNADVDGNNYLDVRDAVKIVKLALGDKKTKNEIEALAKLVNESNYYSKVGVADDGATLTLDGEEKYSYNDRYVLTNGISGISTGNKITFGPVRLGQAVMGYFYDAKGNPLQLINHTNVTVEHQFKQGMVMVSVSVPQGADTVRFQVNAEEKDRFYIRINNDFTVADYQYRTKLKEATLENPLKDQLLLTVGDSLCAAANLKRDSKPDGNLKGWARRIYQQFGAKVINSSEGGSAVSTIKFYENSVQTDTEPLSSRQCIVNQLSEHTNIGREFEYILLEGAGNDAANGAAIGKVSPLYDPESFDMTTYAGGLEMMIYTAIKEHGDTAAIGYMSYYDMPGAPYEGMHRNHEYFAVGKQICEKWGIEYLDLNTILNTSERKDIFNAIDLNVHTHDYIHANDDGYDIMQPYINAFLPQMRPASKKIYDIVQRYDYEVPEFDEYSWDGSISKD